MSFFVEELSNPASGFDGFPRSGAKGLVTSSSLFSEGKSRREHFSREQ